ncbi:MAG: GNAT family N-acetyltransferase [Clostridia bacterium]|nr:GNAT family N-acetyltransferase [Clostridia bacterium]
MIIRKMEKSDIEQVVDINVSCWKRVYKGMIADEFLDSIDREQRIKKILERYGEFPYIVADNGKEVVGFCRYGDSRENEDYDSEIVALYVYPDMLKQGIGSLMFNFVVKEFKKQGKKKMIIWCLKENDNARGFYEKMGGTLIGEKLKQIGEKSYMEVAYGYQIG